jgi:cell division protein FtsQ
MLPPPVILLAILLLAAVSVTLLTGTRAKLLAWSVRAGFRVDDISVVGRDKTSSAQLLSVLGIKRGDAIVTIDLASARHRLEAIPWVRTATIERRLPNRILLSITERVPIALWQAKGRYYLVDGDGQIIGDQIDDYPHLPLMVGEGAPDHAQELVALLGAEPSLRGRVTAAAWVGERRWNITLDTGPGGILVQLPDEGAEAAWHDLALLDKEQKLLERQVGVIDMRLPDRLILRAGGGDVAAKHKTVNGKEA